MREASTKRHQLRELEKVSILDFQEVYGTSGIKAEGKISFVDAGSYAPTATFDLGRSSEDQIELQKNVQAATVRAAQEAADKRLEISEAFYMADDALAIAQKEQRLFDGQELTL